MQILLLLAANVVPGRFCPLCYLIAFNKHVQPVNQLGPRILCPCLHFQHFRCPCHTNRETTWVSFDTYPEVRLILITLSNTLFNDRWRWCSTPPLHTMTLAFDTLRYTRRRSAACVVNCWAFRPAPVAKLLTNPSRTMLLHPPTSPSTGKRILRHLPLLTRDTGLGRAKGERESLLWSGCHRMRVAFLWNATCVFG